MRGLRLNVGDVFSIPIDATRVGVGQIAATYGNDAYFFAVFDAVFSDSTLIDLEQAVGERVTLLALSLDAKLAVGDWTLIGHRPVSDRMPLPAYKEQVGGPGRIDVVDYSGQRRRLAQGRESVLLPNRKFVAPIRLEKALRAMHGLEPWTEAYSELVPNEATTTEYLFR